MSTVSGSSIVQPTAAVAELDVTCSLTLGNLSGSTRTGVGRCPTPVDFRIVSY